MNLGISKELWREFSIAARHVIAGAYLNVKEKIDHKVDPKKDFESTISLAVTFAKMYKAGAEGKTDPKRGQMPDAEEMEIFVEACGGEMVGSGPDMSNPELKA